MDPPAETLGKLTLRAPAGEAACVRSVQTRRRWSALPLKSSPWTDSSRVVAAKSQLRTLSMSTAPFVASTPGRGAHWQLLNPRYTFFFCLIRTSVCLKYAMVGDRLLWRPPPGPVPSLGVSRRVRGRSSPGSCSTVGGGMCASES